MGFNRVKENKERHFGKSNSSNKPLAKKKLSPVSKPKYNSFQREF